MEQIYQIDNENALAKILVGENVRIFRKDRKFYAVKKEEKKKHGEKVAYH